MWKIQIVEQALSHSITLKMNPAVTKERAGEFLKQHQSYTLGKTISLTQVEKMAEMAHRHGFRVSGFRSFEHAITDETINEIRQKAHQEQTQFNWVNP